MARGPRPTPTKILQLRGSWRGKTRHGEPQPEPALPRCPKHLSADARTEWRRLASELFKLGTLTRCDRAVFAAYCQCYARWVEAEAKIAEQGTVVKSPNGYPISNPYLSVSNEALRQMKGFAGELGLSPAARTRIAVRAPAVDDPFDNFLNGTITKRRRG